MAETATETVTPSCNPVCRITSGKLAHDVNGFTEVLTFLRKLAQMDGCLCLGSRGKRKLLKCTCLHCLRPVDGKDPEALRMAASYVCYFGSLDNTQRRLLEIEFIKSAERNRRKGVDFGKTYHIDVMTTERFEPVPMSKEVEELQKQVHDIPVCMNAFRLIFGLGNDRFGTSKKHALANTFPRHGLAGKTGNESNKTTTDIVDACASLHQFLEKLTEEATAPATRVTRQLAGDTLRHEEEGCVELPHYYSKRSLYQRWCFECGWKISTDADGIEKKVPRPFDETFWPEGSEQKPVVSWPKFLAYWKENFKLLRVRPKSEDTCSECALVALRFKYKAFRRMVETNDIQTGTDAHDLLDIIRTNNIDFQGGDTDDADIQILERCLTHVKAHKKQRELHKRIQVEATASKEVYQQQTGHQFQLPLVADGDRSSLKLSFTCDFCQNLGLPYLGAEQVGDAYYFSPLNVFAFGIADETRRAPNDGDKNDHLDAYVYCEHQAKKGGDNVASLLYKHLSSNSLLDSNNPIGEITFTFDNCAGQNKNRMVIRLAAWLVEKGFFNKVRLLFLVRGHTKNACDRLFNLLKRLYREMNIYSYQRLIKVLSGHHQVDAHAAEEQDFLPWDEYLGRLYMKPAGVTEKPHVFWFEKETPGKLFYQAFDGEDVQFKLLRSRINANGREALLARDLPAPVEPPGMKDIKRVELWTKWRKFVPEEERQDFWFTEEPSADVLSSGRTDRSERANQRGNAPATDNS